MSSASIIPNLLTLAWLLPLVAFAVICLGCSMVQRRQGQVPYELQRRAGLLSVGAIGAATLLSFIALFVWLGTHEWTGGAHGGELHPNGPPRYYADDWYSLVEIGSLKLTLGYYVDALTVLMFAMVTFIATCVHVYALGYMHDELHEVTDHEVNVRGRHLHRPGRFHRFFQYLSLFSFSMLGIVIAGNLAMVFMFWELVGICSYFLIGFYIERHSASTAANKAFIVNRVGDFGMLIGMMALWASVGTFSFGDIPQGDKVQPGLFSQLRNESNDFALVPTVGFVSPQEESADAKYPGYWLLTIAGIGIFCGCVGKSAQFPLHVWLPDAMEGPTPVSALVHSATMVAAGVYLVGRFYPVFTPEALLVIAYTGCITLFIAATIALTATDIKRVLAYSTVSQLGYMMLALGIGGWVAGMFHLMTHAFFKSLLFLCSGSVIHAVHTNELPLMGGLRKKMPITAYTMLVGCLAIIGAGLPIAGIGLSGYYSKDAIIEQALSFAKLNGPHRVLLLAPVLGAVLTAFYMFRMWYLAFVGPPRDKHRYDHAHESPRVMTVPLLVLAFMAIAAGWNVGPLCITGLLESAQPIGTAVGAKGSLAAALTIPAESLSHAPAIKQQAGLWAFGAAALGVLLATVFYCWKVMNSSEVASTFRPIHRLLLSKWWFDELYDWVFVKPTLAIGLGIAWVDRRMIDGLIHFLARCAKWGAGIVGSIFDVRVIDGAVDGLAALTWGGAGELRKIQTGRLRQYVMFIVLGFLALTFAALGVAFAR